VTQAFESLLSFIGGTLSSVRNVVRNAMRNITQRGVGDNVQENISITALKDEAQILERTTQKFDPLTGASLLSDLNPDADISNEHSEVQAVCNAVWTDKVKADYETFKNNQENI